MELRNMQISRVKDQLEHIQLAAIEVAHGCGMAREITPTTEDVGLLVTALFEMHGCATELLHKMTSEKDHDGDTEPNNERPQPSPSAPPASEPWWMQDPPKCQCGHGRDVHGPAGPATPHEGLVCYMIDCPCKAFVKC
jgi:hypothetical protein